MFGVRSIQTFGTIRKLKAPIEAKIEEVIIGSEGNSEDNEIFAFSQSKIEWQSSRNEELIGDIRHEIIEHIKNKKNKKHYVKKNT
jgi:hypothetical protein